MPDIPALRSFAAVSGMSFFLFYHVSGTNCTDFHIVEILIDVAGRWRAAPAPGASFIRRCPMV